MQEKADVFIIGGGINGCGIARDASGRGLSVILCEQNDLASSTSSASTKLIHGGLRYLEHGEFKLVRSALREREILLAQAPHVISPLEFIIPHTTNSRPYWLIRLGLFLYDHLSARPTLPSSKNINLHTHIAGQFLRREYTKGFSYADCWVDDSRLVILNAIAAREQEAQIYPHMRFLTATRRPDYWEITAIKDEKIFHFQAKVLINAAGPWVNQVADLLGTVPKKSLRLVQGSHIVVPKLFDHPFAYLLQSDDKRIIFVISYQNDFTLIGTTETSFGIEKNLNQIEITESEVKYLCQQVNHYFKKNLSDTDIKWKFSGVRPLVEDYSHSLRAVTRDYELLFDHNLTHAPYLAIYGGKITVYRQLAEKVLKTLEVIFPNMSEPWTEKSYLPGGKEVKNHFSYEKLIAQHYPWLPQNLRERWVRSYGNLIFKLLDNVRSMDDLGEAISEDLYAKEVEYLIQYEWAHTTQDILWRRTKLGLKFTDIQKDKLKKVMASLN